MTEDRKKALLAKIDGSEELCNYCPLPEESRGAVNYHSMCEGRRCLEAFEAYLEEMEEEEL